MTLPICEKLVWLANGLDRSVHPDAGAASEAAVLIGEFFAELQQFVNGVETGMIESPADETLANITNRARKVLAKARGEQP